MFITPNILYRKWKEVGSNKCNIDVIRPAPHLFHFLSPLLQILPENCSCQSLSTCVPRQVSIVFTRKFNSEPPLPSVPLLPYQSADRTMNKDGDRPKFCHCKIQISFVLVSAYVERSYFEKKLQRRLFAKWLSSCILEEYDEIIFIV